MIFGQPKLDERNLDKSDQWGREAEEWTKKRAKHSIERKDGDFLITEKVLADGIKVVVKRWNGSRKLAEVAVFSQGGEAKIYRARYEQGNVHWSAISGGMPEDFPEAEKDELWKQEKMF